MRLLELQDGRYRRWPHLADGTLTHMLRYAALTLLVDDDESDAYHLPAQDAPFDGLPHPAADWPLEGALLPWYREAGLVQQNADDTWQALPDALEPLAATTPTAQALNVFLEHLRRVRASPRDLPPLDNTPLPVLDPAILEARIAEIQQTLLIDRTTILRIYRALIAGQHVILSGPPGTGKTHLAKILPSVLWRDAQPIVVLRMQTQLESSPTDPPAADPDPLQREGYIVDVVTATEDWGVRQVIGGIAPLLQPAAQGNTLVYGVRHGCLTRAVLRNYQGYDGVSIPNLEPLQRHEPRDPKDRERRYRGVWLVIDEFTRAQIDAAFGSLLTTLGGQDAPTIPVPTDNGDEYPVPLPRDFRLIGTLNSFDRHFLNQISEAMKRRFAFIDILPPGRDLAEREQAQALFRALLRLGKNHLAGVTADEASGVATLRNLFSVHYGEQGYTITWHDPEAQAVVQGFWRLFTAIRIYRALGTAQAEAACAALLAGYSIGMDWALALDSALADTLADQLQVLARDEQRVLLAVIEHPNNPDALRNAMIRILEQYPAPRQAAHLLRLKTHEDPQLPIDELDPKKLTVAQVAFLFGVAPDLPQVVAANGLFAQRLRAFAGEHGL